MVGLNKNILTLIDEIYLNPNYGFQIAGLFTDAIVSEELKKYHKGSLLRNYLFFRKNIRWMKSLFRLPYHQSKLINDLFRYADNHMMRVRVIPEFSEYLSQAFSIDYIENIPIMKLTK